MIMTKEEENNVLAGIQAALEEMKDSGDDILFLESRNNRGLLSGTIEGLAALFAWNMAAYPAFVIVVEMARNLYIAKEKELKQMVASGKPSHEIVDNYGNDFEEMLKIVKK